jgi:hypothetical protein
MFMQIHLACFLGSPWVALWLWVALYGVVQCFGCVEVVGRCLSLMNNLYSFSCGQYSCDRLEKEEIDLGKSKVPSWVVAVSCQNHPC